MTIVILGAGKIGSYLASTLSSEERNVIVIDKESRPLEKVARTADVATQLGSGTDWRLLEEIAQRSPYLFIALSSDDETNLVACSIAKNLGFQKTVARVRNTSFLNQARLDFGRLFFVDHFIGTEMIAAHDIFKAIQFRGSTAVEHFAHGAVQMRTIVIPKDWREGSVQISEFNLNENLLVGLIKKQATQELIFPRGTDWISAGDEVTFIGETEAMHGLNRIFGLPQEHVESVIIAGGSATAVELVHVLHDRQIRTTLIEPDDERCKELARLLPHATIINQDFTDPQTLRAENVGSAHAFVASTASSETNVFTAILAKEEGSPYPIAVISDAHLMPVLHDLGIAYTLSERVSIANRIHAIIDADSVIAVTSLYGNQAKILEVKISIDSTIAGIPLADLRHKIPKDFLIALIYNRGRVLVARGSHILSPGDTVIVICSPEAVKELSNVF
jgi:trk system potassium uptake protein TrkA